MKIALLSDSHGYMKEDVLKHLKEVDEIWHAGDIGTLAVMKPLHDLTKVRAVWGNIDTPEVCSEYAKDLIWEMEGMKVWMTHIGGYPGRYPTAIKKKLLDIKPDIFICGHSHILKIIFDKELNLLHLNPGAIGQEGFHKMRTLLLFDIIDKKISNMRIVELGLRGKLSTE